MGLNGILLFMRAEVAWTVSAGRLNWYEVNVLLDVKLAVPLWEITGLLFEVSLPTDLLTDIFPLRVFILTLAKDEDIEDEVDDDEE